MNKFIKFAGLTLALVFVFGLTGINKASAATCVFTGSLTIGASGAEVTCLQEYLISAGYSIPAGATGYFGTQTQMAVAAWQTAHNVAPAAGYFGPLSQATYATLMSAMGSGSGSTTYSPGCSSNTGFSSTTGLPCTSVVTTFPAGCSSTAGFSTTTGMSCSSGMTSLPAGCTSTSGFSSTTGMSCGNGSSGSLSGGETSISDVSLDDADDTEINEGEEKVSLGQIQFDVDDADAELDRVDIVFQSDDNQVSTDAGEEEDPWKVFDTVYLLDEDGNEIASMSADDEDNWDEADQLASMTDAEAFRIRFSDVSEIFEEGANNATIWVAADIASSVDGADSDDAQWTIAIEVDGLRFTDGAGIDTEVDAGSAASGDTAGFAIQEAGADSEFTVSESSDSPDAQTLEVNETSTSTETIAIFDLEADSDGGDVKLTDFPLTLTIANTTTGDDMGEVVDDVMVEIDGTTYSADENPSSTDASQTFTFGDIDDDDIVINSGESIEATVMVKFRSQGTGGSNYASGTTIFASTAITSSDVEDADSGDDVGAVDGDATAETMTLAGSGIMVVLSSPAETEITEIDGTFNDTATFTFEVDITAFGDDDVYINKDFADIVTSSTSGDVDIIYAIDVSTGAALTSVSGTISDTSDADEVTADSSAYSAAYSGEEFFKIDNGETESFTITITGTNQTNNKQVRAYLSAIEFTTDDITAATAEDASTAVISSYTANLAEDSQSPFENVQ